MPALIGLAGLSVIAVTIFGIFMVGLHYGHTGFGHWTVFLAVETIILIIGFANVALLRAALQGACARRWAEGTAFGAVILGVGLSLWSLAYDPGDAIWMVPILMAVALPLSLAIFISRSERAT